MIASLRDPAARRAASSRATTLADVVMDELMLPALVRQGQADYALRSIAAGAAHPEPHRGEAWSIVALAVPPATDEAGTPLSVAPTNCSRKLGPAARRANVASMSLVLR